MASINETILNEKLVAIGDALRGKFGETVIQDNFLPYGFEFTLDKEDKLANYYLQDYSPYGNDPSNAKWPSFKGFMIVIDDYNIVDGINPSDCVFKGSLDGNNTSFYPASENFYLLPKDQLPATYISNLDSYKIHKGGLCITYNTNDGYLNEDGCYIKGRMYGIDENNEIVYYIDSQEEVRNTYTLDEMANAINGMGDILPEEALTVTGNCQYRFANGGWSWFINNFGDKITTKDIEASTYMFNYSTDITSIPFDINYKSGYSHDASNIFANCTKLTNVPKLVNMKPSNLTSMFNGCAKLREIPEDYFKDFDWSYMENLTSAYMGNLGSMFSGCNSLRKLPNLSYIKGNPIIAYSYSFYSGLAARCYALDEIVNLPVIHRNSNWTSNAMGTMNDSCYRLKNFTFALQEDGTPYVVNWKSQTINLFNLIGCASSTSTRRDFLNYSGIGEDKEVKDDATYQALKNDPDWWASSEAYCRYNHDSAVATINSLPDTSAYLATAGGTNTIKFKGAFGAKTDGGAINTLTPEEIAVATAKGWTVSLV